MGAPVLAAPPAMLKSPFRRDFSLPLGLAAAARRCGAGMYRVHMPGYDLETMRAVAVAYRREGQAGPLDQPKFARCGGTIGTSLQ